MENENFTIFFDMDGTLTLNDDLNSCFVPGCSWQALKELKKANHNLIVCTGRQPSFVKSIFGDFFDGMITLCGNYIEYENKKIFHTYLSEERINYIIHTYQKFCVTCCLVGINDVQVIGFKQENLIRVKNNYSADTKIHLDSYENQFEVSIMDFFFDNYYEYELCRPYFTDDMTVNIHNEIRLPSDATFNYANKGEGIKKVIDYLEIDKNKTIAFGDGINDIPMFKEVGTSIAMGNGVEQAKQAANYVAKDVDKSGILEISKMLNLI